MRHIAIVVIAVVAVTAGNAWASQYFQEGSADANGDFLWNESNNWMSGIIPNSTSERAYFDGSETCVIYSTMTVQQMRLGDSGVHPTLTVRAGANLTVGYTGASFGALKMAAGSDATMNIEGGVLNALGNVTFTVGYGEAATTGYVYQSGGTVDAPGTIILGRTGSGLARGEYYLSGGVINCGNLNITNATQSSSSVFEISGGDFNSTATGYSSGLKIYDGGTLRIIGGLATIDVADALWSGGWKSSSSDYYDATTVSFKVNATGISTINAADWNITDTTYGGLSTLELLADGAAVDSYTLVHTIDEVTSADLAVLNMTGDAGFTNLRVVDVAGDGSAGYDVTVDYIPEPATMLLLTIGGLGVLLRKRR